MTPDSKTSNSMAAMTLYFRHRFEQISVELEFLACGIERKIQCIRNVYNFHALNWYSILREIGYMCDVDL